MKFRLNSSSIHTILTLLAIMFSTTVLFLYTSGFRVEKKEEKIDVKQTGMVSAKSVPEGASVYLDDVLTTATNDTIPGINPGKHILRIYKKGFVEWTKEIEVFTELVTDMTAVLVSQTARLEPLTNTGASFAQIAPSLNKVAFFSKDPTNPGISIIALSQGGINIFRSNPATIKDTPKIKFSNGKSIEWSPDEKSILVGIESGYFLVDITNDTTELVTNTDKIRTTWMEELSKKRKDFIEKVEIPEDIRKIAESPKSIWAPDEKKFMYTMQKADKLEYRVYNMEKPLPVGEKPDNLVFTTIAKDLQPTVTWYSDSFHLLVTEGNIEKDKRGSINIIRIDGTNKTEIYNNTLHSNKVFSAPGGDKLIILTSFKSGDITDLYTIGIR